METRRQGSTIFGAILVLVATLIIVQLWLVSAALDAWLGGEAGVGIPAAAASLGLFAINGGLLWYVVRLDRRIRDAEDR